MKTKAETLSEIKNNISEINVLPIYTVESEHYCSQKETCIKKIIDFSLGSFLIIRSSSSKEDGECFSNAGKFESILNVEPSENSIKEAIETVYKSYGTSENEQILVQPMLKNIVKSGVVFTADMDTFSEYYIVNYFNGENTAAVTAGDTNELVTYIEYRNSEIHSKDKTINKLIEYCKLLQNYFNNKALDIEFAVNDKDEVYIFQVRPIAKGNKIDYKDFDIKQPLNRIYKKIKKLSMRHPFLLGDTTIFGVMPDWNPAEILGIRPKKLAISLYKELITDNIWAHQRYNYGYRDLTMHPLMISFCGVPYIDTRVTFNSFIPNSLDDEIAEKLVNYYINKLSKYPKYHDKVEFEIVFSCYYLGLADDLRVLLAEGFNENELKRIEFSLLQLTNNIISPQNGLYKKDINTIQILEENYDKIINADISVIDKIYWLIEECKTYGTLPFAGVARAAFIAVQFLKSFVKLGIICQEDYDNYMNSLDTINSEFNHDLFLLREGKYDRKSFLEKYGHIRPGTYDILSKRYDEAFEDYFGDGHICSKINDCNFEFSEMQKQRIALELRQNGILISFEELMVFIKESIEGREKLKFIFTKSVSKILQLIEELGNKNSCTREDMAYIDISIVKQLYSDLFTGDIRSMFRENIDTNKGQYNKALLIKLPSLIVSPENVYSFTLLKDEPNFITQKKIRAKSIILAECDDYGVEGNIVFIKSADPGYDFLFSKNIGGLVTQFGGANSHMAIRCAEMGIPAVIGAGDRNFNEWGKSEKIEIDCLNKKVTCI